MKSAKNLTVDRNSFTESRCSEQRTGITKKCAYARFYEMPHGFVKSIPLTYEEGIDRPHFEAYDVHFRNNISHRIACDKMKMQEVNWTLRTAEEYKVCKNAGALCIFEFIRPEITDEDE